MGGTVIWHTRASIHLNSLSRRVARKFIDILLIAVSHIHWIAILNSFTFPLSSLSHNLNSAAFKLCMYSASRHILPGPCRLTSNHPLRSPSRRPLSSCRPFSFPCLSCHLHRRIRPFALPVDETCRDLGSGIVVQACLEDCVCKVLSARVYLCGNGSEGDWR